ncbi:Lon protease like protein [Verticillium longisporum]|nr:Lon protease like protein [Verticillium longisporum]
MVLRTTLPRRLSLVPQNAARRLRTQPARRLWTTNPAWQSSAAAAAPAVVTQSRRVPTSCSSNARPHTLAAFSTSSRALKEDKDKDQGFFDRSVESLSEDEKKANLENQRDLEDELAEASKGPASGSAADAAAKSEGAADGKAGSAAGGSSGSSGDGSGSGSGDGGRRGRKSAERSLQKPVVPDVYPQVLAIPIAKRPLFPGFYKAITIKDPNVAAAITEMIKRCHP